MDTKQKLKKLVDYFGSQTGAAKFAGLSQSAVCYIVGNPNYSGKTTVRTQHKVNEAYAKLERGEAQRPNSNTLPIPLPVASRPESEMIDDLGASLFRGLRSKDKFAILELMLQQLKGDVR